MTLLMREIEVIAYDHVSGKYIKGFQMLTLGCSDEIGF